MSKDPEGRVITTCDVYPIQLEKTVGATYNRMVYLGSEFFTYPAWQQGTVQLGGREIACQLSFHLVSGELSYQLNNAETPERVQPEAFTVGGHRFIRLPIGSGSNNKVFLQVVNNGTTKLLKHLKTRLVNLASSDGYQKREGFSGRYEILETYYLKKGNANPEQINLTKKSILSVLEDQSEQLAARLPDKNITPESVVNILKYYDELTSELSEKKLTLGSDPVFKQTLRKRIAYPTQARLNHVYGRTYVSFDVDTNGNIQNIALISPDNAGYGFDQEVKQGLKKLPPLNPEYAGSYLLPIAFTYTKSYGTPVTFVPINKLPADRVKDLVELEEITIPLTVAYRSFPEVDGREVWGYYK
ncbi:TonB family protein [Larkinella rosea]|uniref:TonB family protein n=1 Tax=Larkinella rosea TaxID=2025312 RepID=UPI001639DD68|nr:TonB family protein [Larkinella rosea]